MATARAATAKHTASARTTRTTKPASQFGRVRTGQVRRPVLRPRIERMASTGVSLAATTRIGRITHHTVFRIVGDKDRRTSKFGYTTGLFPYGSPEMASHF